MRVTLISKALVVGAYQTKLEALAAFPDIELTVMVPSAWREGRQLLYLERAHTQGYRLEVLPIWLNGSYHLHCYPTLPSILRASAPDICHIDEEPYNLATGLALRMARRLGAKTLFFTWQNLLRRYPWPFSALERYVYTHVDAAIAGNREAVDVLRAKGYRGRVEVIPQFGVDPDLYRPLPRQRQDADFVIGYAGRLEEAKGLGVLVDALAAFEGTWRLEVYGSGPFREPLEARLATLGLAERVDFGGHIASERLPQALAELDVLVLPSLTRPNWKEQFGRILVEAMACGVPVVGSNSGEIPNVIGDAGLVFPEGDAAALRACLERLRASEDLRRELSVRGRNRVLERYTQRSVAAATVALYRALYAGD